MTTAEQITVAIYHATNRPLGPVSVAPTIPGELAARIAQTMGKDLWAYLQWYGELWGTYCGQSSRFVYAEDFEEWALSEGMTIELDPYDDAMEGGAA